MEQLLAHLVGDYWLQTDWMAANKYYDNPKHTSRLPAALVCLLHVLTYVLPFLLLTRSWLALVVIGGTHWAIDHFKLGAWFSWFKNHLTPGAIPWATARTNFGYDPAKPAWIACWLSIIVDNIMHLVLNYAALRWL
jgi:hypothetical protein